MNLDSKEVCKRYDEAKRKLKFNQKDFAKEVGITPERFSIINDNNFTNCAENTLIKIDKALKNKGF